MAKRWSPKEAWGDAIMVEDKQGDYVLHDDFVELQSELQRIMSALIELAECGK